MPTLSPQELPPTSSFWQSILSLLLADPAKVLTLARELRQFVLSRFQREGLCEVLEQEMRLILNDSSGRTAVIHKRQKIRFLQNNVIAFQDQAWGLGDIFAEYKCSPGVPVDRYLEGYRYRVLISLRQTKNRGDIEEFRMERHIRNGFIRSNGSFQTVVEYKTHRLVISVVFPSGRKPFEMLLVEQQSGRTTILGAEHIRQLPDGNQVVEWSTDRPRQFESYVFRWKW